MKPAANRFSTWSTVYWRFTAHFLQFRVHKDDDWGFLEEFVDEGDAARMLLLGEPTLCNLDELIL